MDICKNKIDLYYFTNSTYLNRFNKSQENDNLNEEIKFYKKRIFQLAKDILRKKEGINKTVEGAFLEFSRFAIQHFKFEDKKEIYQKEYDNMKNIEKKKPLDNFEIMTTDKIITKEVKISQKSVKELLNVKSNIKKKQMILPSKKSVNINTEYYKMKGVKEKEKSK